MRPLWLVGAVIAVLAAASYAEVTFGFAHSEYGFAFLGKFCFDFTVGEKYNKESGSIEVKLYLEPHISAPPHDLRLLVYDDQKFSWPAIYHKRMHCSDALSKAIVDVPVKFDKHNTFIFSTSIFEHIRPRFWYVVLANCDRVYGVQYTMHFRNSADSTWQAEFGVNEQGLNTICLIFFIVSTALAAAYAYGLREKYNNEPFPPDQSWMVTLWYFAEKLPPIHRVFAGGLFCLWVSSFLEVFHYTLYAADGVGALLTHAAAQLIWIAAQVLMLFLLLLMAQGWSISTESLQHRAQTMITFVLLGASYWLLLLWAAGRDRASTLYVYDSFPGMCIIILNLGAGAMFLWFLYKSREAETNEDKRHFYFLLGICYTWWFVSLAVTVAIAQALSPWVREKIVTGVQLAMDTIAYGGMVYFLWPSHSDKYFKVAAPDVGGEYDSLINETM